MVSSVNLLAPLESSWADGELEEQQKSLLMDVFNDLFGEQIQDIFSYGQPQNGSLTVIERFSKQDGLVVLPRRDSSDKLMRVIYSQWKAMGSRRGLAFLEFVLQMLWEDKWEIERLYHSIERIEGYPTLVTADPVADSFQTSRISIDLDQTVDFSQVLELAPVLMRLVPANIVPQVSSSITMGDIETMYLGMGFTPYMTADFQCFDKSAIAEDAPWTGWLLANVFRIENRSVRYESFKSNAVLFISSFAVVPLAQRIVKSFHIPEFQRESAFSEAIRMLTGQSINNELDFENEKIKVTFLPDPVDESAASLVLMQRIAVLRGQEYEGMEGAEMLMSLFDWVLEGGKVCEMIPAPENMREPDLYSTADVFSYASYLDAASKHILIQQQPGKELENAELGVLEVAEELPDETRYIQHYTYLPDPVQPEPGEPAPPDPEPIAAEYSFSVTHAPNPDFVAVDAKVPSPLDESRLNNAIADARQIAADTSNSALTAEIDQAVFDAHVPDQSGIGNSLADNTTTELTFLEVAEQILDTYEANEPSNIYIFENYVNAVANTIYDADPDRQLIKPAELEADFEQNQSPS